MALLICAPVGDSFQLSEFRRGAMTLITVKDKFQVTIPAKLRERIGVRVGDLMEATVH
jgi:AbrB family looped-hinge helix DNA binding protein